MPRKKDLTGIRFERLTALHPEGHNSSGKIMWVCKCDCGSIKRIERGSLTNGDTKSCGCIQSDKKKSKMKEYRAWAHMIQRCENPNNSNYATYGAIGIRVYPEWVKSFDSFFAYIGARPSDQYSIDRIDVLKGYEPGNVRWATREIQNNNKRDSINIIIDGKRILVKDLAKQVGVHPCSIRAYIKNHSIERAIEKYTSPKYRKQSRYHPRFEEKTYVSLPRDHN